MNTVCEKIGGMKFEGNIIPSAWYKAEELRLESGKPNLVAIILLADICYWYRPTIIRDEESGAVVERRQKFKADKLQKSYETWGEGFGFTKRQTSDAVAFLRDREIIVTECRNVIIAGQTVPNVVFLEPIPEVIGRLSGLTAWDMPRYNVGYPPVERDTVLPSAVGYAPVERANTYNTAENTTENTAETKQAPGVAASPAKKERENAELFASFWEFFLSINRAENKPAALKEWNRIKPDKYLYWKIIRALENQKEYKEKARKLGAFVPEWPYAARWLKEARYNQEIPANVPQAAQKPSGKPADKYAGMNLRERAEARLERLQGQEQEAERGEGVESEFTEHRGGSNADRKQISS